MLLTPRRAVGVLLRTAHLATFAALLGGHVFDVDPTRLWPWLVATLISGAGLMALELLSGVAWLGTAKGLAVLVLAGVASHMPRQFRHHQVVRIREVRGRPACR